MMAFESGIDKEDLEKSMLPRLSPKVVYEDGWVFIKNFDRYHSGGPNAEKGRAAAINSLPSRIRAKILDILGEIANQGNPIEGGSPSTFTSTSASTFNAAHTRGELTLETDEDMLPSRQVVKRGNIEKGSKSHLTIPLLRWGEQRLGRKFPKPTVQMRDIADMLSAGYTPKEIMAKWDDLMRDDFWSQQGVDFKVVASQIGKQVVQKKKPGVTIIS